MIKNIIEGLKKGIPISVAYIPYAFSLGALSASLNIPTHIIVLMSLFVYAGSSQIIFLTIFPYVSTILDLIFPMIIVNIRYILINLPLIRKQKEYKDSEKILSSFLLSDEGISYMLSREIYDPYIVFGFNFLGYLAFVISTLLGSIIGKNIPAVYSVSLNFCLYAILLSLLVDISLKNLKLVYVIILTIFIKVTLEYFNFYKSITIIISVLLATLIATIIKIKFKGEEII